MIFYAGTTILTAVKILILFLFIAGYTLTSVGVCKVSSSNLEVSSIGEASETDSDTDADSKFDMFGEEIVPAFYVLRWSPEPEPVPQSSPILLMSDFPQSLFRPPIV